MKSARMAYNFCQVYHTWDASPIGRRAMTSDFVGKTFGGFQIVEELGRGGMATVYCAQQLSMQRTVALKVLPPQFLHDRTFLERFRQEAAIVARLEHRAI